MCICRSDITLTKPQHFSVPLSFCLNPHRQTSKFYQFNSDRLPTIIFHAISLQQYVVQERNLFFFFIRRYSNGWNDSANSPWKSLDPCRLNHCFLSGLSVCTSLFLNSCISPDGNNTVCVRAVQPPGNTR